LSSIPAPGLPQPVIRVVDMGSMAPTPRLFSRLAKGDWAVVSLGVAKCLYSGWGALGFTDDEALARDVRSIRSTHMRQERLGWTLLHAFKVTRKALLNQRRIYPWATRLRTSLSKLSQSKSIGSARVCADNMGLSAREWSEPMTFFDRKLAMRNLSILEKFQEIRMRIVRRYQELFSGASKIRQVQHPGECISHYVVRVESSVRERMRYSLFARGVDTGILYPYPSHLLPAAYPKSKTLSDEILNLPLHTGLCIEDVDFIASNAIKLALHL
jgi:dTDP-4-amino-4,6-dideoxygalactose transaminase